MIFANGTTGEWKHLANMVRQRLMEISVDEVGHLNGEVIKEGGKLVEIWLGVNGSTRREVLDNLDLAIRLKADAAVIAPLAINDLEEEDITRFFLRDLNDLIEGASRMLPVFLYDNADINAPGRTSHIPTRIVKEVSRLPWVYGLKVSASRNVLGNYTKAALHYKQPGEFGIYIGNAPLIFEWYRPQHGLVGRFRSGWHEYLLHDALPIGVVSGPANVLPREWQKAWNVSWAGDEELSGLYRYICGRFNELCAFEEKGRSAVKMLACFKYALELDGVISNSTVCKDTPPLTDEQKKIFSDAYHSFSEERNHRLPERWRTRVKVKV